MSSQQGNHLSPCGPRTSLSTPGDLPFSPEHHQVIKLLQSKYHYKEEAKTICDKVQVKLSKECFHPSSTCITDLRTLHWEEAIQETKGGAANRILAEECYFLWKSTRLQHMILAEDVKAMLTELRKEVRLLLLTNGDCQTQREKIEACACQSYFDAIVVGGEQKEEKPSPSIFYYCCSLLGVQPGDCVMVGDTLETDIQGGLNAGLKATVWINKNGIMPLKSSPMPHYIISSVLELPAVLQSIDCTVNMSA
ncbi:N-acylneuraminate-9-phosphatase isoform X2 [Lynx canadensis]|uniref:N-acylneuraminate-9-phosphatase isoform X2 n=1 Tax=Lynx canadensis TaxID=61383 RepID=UPI0011B0DFD0|nr:N-acylneuraminate-9-phosphatase isoform X2 [Lynx canadensis]XP_046924931.1 N-acylneuraminate-9-phosphatase isoform X2 [Lynx rufus]